MKKIICLLFVLLTFSHKVNAIDFFEFNENNVFGCNFGYTHTGNYNDVNVNNLTIGLTFFGVYIDTDLNISGKNCIGHHQPSNMHFGYRIPIISFDNSSFYITPNIGCVPYGFKLYDDNSYDSMVNKFDYGCIIGYKYHNFTFNVKANRYDLGISIGYDWELMY